METDNMATEMQRTENMPAVQANNTPAEQETSIHKAMEKMMPQIRAALPRHMTPERLARIALTTIRTNPDLMACTMPSLLAAVMQAAQLGLEPNLLGQCYFVPHNNKKRDPRTGKETWAKEVTFIPGYKGLMKLARRSNDILTIQSDVVYTGDKFELIRGYAEKLEHVPNYFGARGAIAGFYAYALTKDGGRYSEFMSKEQVDGIRNRSKAKDRGPWVSDYEQMGRKTVLRRLCNYLDLEVEQMEILQKLDDNEFSQSPVTVELNAEQRTPTRSLNEELDAAEHDADRGEESQEAPDYAEVSQEVEHEQPVQQSFENGGTHPTVTGDELWDYALGGGKYKGKTINNIRKLLPKLLSTASQQAGLTEEDVRRLVDARLRMQAEGTWPATQTQNPSA